MLIFCVEFKQCPLGITEYRFISDEIGEVEAEIKYVEGQWSGVFVYQYSYWSHERRH
jgi:hypothetical protein